jgi:hypothetical protein
MDFARATGLVLAIPILLILLAAALVVRRSRRPSLGERFRNRNQGLPDPEPGSFTNCQKCGMAHAPGAEHAR